MPEYTITFNAAGGTVSPASKKLARDAVIGELPVPQRAGYNFAGWKNEATGTWYDATMAMPSGDMTLTAQWAAGTNKVTFMEYDADASKAQGKVTYKKVSVIKKKFAKKITVNKKTGKITVKKGLKKGTYKLKIKVTAAGTTAYKAGSKTVTVKIKVK